MCAVYTAPVLPIEHMFHVYVLSVFATNGDVCSRAPAKAIGHKLSQATHLLWISKVRRLEENIDLA